MRRPSRHAHSHIGGANELEARNPPMGIQIEVPPAGVRPSHEAMQEEHATTINRGCHDGERAKKYSHMEIFLLPVFK